MRARHLRKLTAVFSIALLTCVRVQAGPIVINQVIQVLGSYQNPPDLRLRTASENSSLLVSEIKGATDTDNKSAGAVGSGISSSLFGGLSTPSITQQTSIDVLAQGNVEGTVCDCGDILIPVGGFPKWPLLFLAGIPLFFIHDSEDHQNGSPTPTPTPTPTPPGPTPTPTPPIPEPTSLLLFGSGLAALGAFWGRRYRQKKVSTKIQSTEER